MALLLGVCWGPDSCMVVWGRFGLFVSPEWRGVNISVGFSFGYSMLTFLCNDWRCSWG